MKLAIMSLGASIFAGCLGLGAVGVMGAAGENKILPSQPPISHEVRFQQQDIRLLSAPVQENSEIHPGATQRWIF